MTEHNLIDERFLTGLWYDIEGEAFVRIDTDGENVLLMHRTDEVTLFEMPVDDFEESDFYPVPEEAINDPVGYYVRFVHQMRGELEDWDVGFDYASRVTRVVERD